MKTFHRLRIAPMALISVLILVLGGSALAGEMLRYSASAQVHDAFLNEGLGAFSQETGIAVDLFVGSSESAFYRLKNGVADIASTVEELSGMHKDYGYVQTAFCQDPIVVITNVETTVRNLTESQLRGIFSGDITNWHQVGGQDKSIVVVVPGKNTGAFHNFRQLAFKRFDVKYDIMTYRSTMVIELVRRLEGSISFISRGAALTDKALKTININGMSPDDPGYPYVQTFYFITQGAPQGPAKALIDFANSDKAAALMKQHGMFPVH